VQALDQYRDQMGTKLSSASKEQQKESGQNRFNRNQKEERGQDLLEEIDGDDSVHMDGHSPRPATRHCLGEIRVLYELVDGLLKTV
jgi:hypothetical protein